MASGPVTARTWGLRLLASVIAVILVSGHEPQVEPVAAAQGGTDTGRRMIFRQRDLPRLAVTGGERRVVRSILNIAGPMAYGEFAWDDEGIPDGETWIRVDLGAQIISVFRAGHEIGTSTVAFGTDGKPTPAGRFTILEKDADHVSSIYDAPMPYMLRLTGDGIAIHGSDVRIGAATHGCVGVPLAFAEKLFGQARLGGEVVVI